VGVPIKRVLGVPLANEICELLESTVKAIEDVPPLAFSAGAKVEAMLLIRVCPRRSVLSMGALGCCGSAGDVVRQNIHCCGLGWRGHGPREWRQLDEAVENAGS
jgi:hypothetical protein